MFCLTYIIFIFTDTDTDSQIESYKSVEMMDRQTNRQNENACKFTCRQTYRKSKSRQV